MLENNALFHAIVLGKGTGGDIPDNDLQRHNGNLLHQGLAGIQLLDEVGGDALLFQGLAQQLCLRGLAGTVGPLKYDQLSHNACLLCMVIRISLYHHFTRL